jgi:hypothetical protein
MRENEIVQAGLIGIILTMVVMGISGWGWVLFVLMLTF